MKKLFKILFSKIDNEKSPFENEINFDYKHELPEESVFSRKIKLNNLEKRHKRIDKKSHKSNQGKVS